MEKNVLEKILDGIMKPADLPLQLLQNITDKFSRDRVIGEGGFGTVYKGIVGNRNVAVKRIATSMTIDEKLFYREVDSLLEVNHQNVVRFLGFCSNTVQTPMKNPIARGYIYAEIRERLLCFEYVSNGSLDKYITDELRGLEWDARFQIIKGVCAGLHYLHMEKHILHMDLKPANILLTKEMVPKITDFGLSRPSENSRTMSTIFFATPGYAAPENMVEGGRMSTKSDMYGLGALIIELVTGHKGSPDNNNILRRWRHRWNKSAKETRLTYQQQVVKCIEIGILCRENDPYKRPSISEIMSKFAEMETNHSRNANGSIIGQINSAYLEDDMLGVEPLELRFANSEQNKNNQISSQCSVELSNDTDGSIAFTIQASSPLPYSIEPNNDILKPRSKCRVVITFPTTRQDHDKATLQYKQYKEFIVRSIKVNEDLTTKDINEGMFNNHAGNVDEVHLTVVSEEPCRREVISADYSCGPLNLHTLELRFPFQPNKYIPCSLHVTNKTDEHVVFRLKEKKKWYSPLLLPLYGLVPPKSVYTLLVTIRKMEELPIEPDTDLIMQSIAIAGRDIPRLCRDDYELIEFFEQVKREKDTLDEVTIKVICAPHGEITAEIIPLMENPDYMRPFDAHPTEPWIIMAHWTSGEVFIWNYGIQGSMRSFEVSASGHSLKLVTQKQWILAAGIRLSDLRLSGRIRGCICVYAYGTKLRKIKELGPLGSGIPSLAVHPTKPYVLSSDGDDIYLWDWENDWKCIQTFRGHSSEVNDLAFDPVDHNSFASASDDFTVKVWNLDVPEASYTLSGHSSHVRCLNFFTRDGQQCLISGSDDETAKIWNLQTKTCLHTIEAIRSRVSCVSSLPDRPYLVTGSGDGLVRLWRSSDYRLERIIDTQLRQHRGITFLACLTGSKRLVIVHPKITAVLDIDQEISI